MKGSDMSGEHGRLADYKAGCRCAECRQANTAYQTWLRGNRTMNLWLDPTIATHGRTSTYLDYGCRCEPCRTAHRDKMRIYMRGRAAARKQSKETA